MNGTLERAIAEASRLDEPAQEAIGREILRWIEKLLALRAEIQIGIDEIDAGLAGPLDFDALLKELHEEYENNRR